MKLFPLILTVSTFMVLGGGIIVCAPEIIAFFLWVFGV